MAHAYTGAARNHPTARLRRSLRQLARAYDHYAMYIALGLGSVAMLWLSVR